MSEYLARCALKGSHPKITSEKHFVSRPHLVAQLLRERHALRVISAPFGFGKRSVAAEYAQTVWQCKHVFWMDATSPCFLRDLDANLIAETLLRLDNEPFLLVILDVPQLDTERTQVLLGCIHAILAQGCEVLVTCTPAHDVFDEERTRLTLEAHELLLGEGEYAALINQPVVSEDPLCGDDLLEVPFAQARRRIPYFAWGKADEREFLKRLFRDDMPYAYQLAVFVALILRRADASAIVSSCSITPDELAHLAQDLGLMNYHKESGSFEALVFGTHELCEAFKPKQTLLKSVMRCSSMQDLITHISEIMIAHHEESRACELVQSALPRADRAAWLAEQAKTLHDHVCLVPTCKVHHSLGRERANVYGKLDVAHALRLLHLGQPDAARRVVLRLARASQAQSEVRVLALVMLSQVESPHNQQKILSTAATLLSNATALHSGLRNQLAFLVCVRKELLDDVTRAGDLVYAYGEKADSEQTYYTAVTWLFDALSQQDECFCTPQLERLGAQVCTLIEAHPADELTLAQATCISSLKALADRGAVAFPAHVEEQLEQAQRMSMDIARQRRLLQAALAHKSQVTKAQSTLPAQTVVSAPAFATSESVHVTSHARAYPPLTVNLLGGLEVFIGQTRVAPENFRRQKIKTLLALLVLNKGKEYARDKLVNLIWPGTSLASGRKGLYSLWSQLRVALCAPDGSCPYLIRQQQSLRLDPTLLQSDVMRMERACQSLLFEQPNYEGWPALLTQVNEEFGEDLLPSDNENITIEAWRCDYRNHLVDALVGASRRLLEAQQPQEGLWFARAALQRDRTREDAYVALARAQLIAGQRTAAMETCLLCRRFLTDELGMDPSVELMRLYHSIIESEEVLV